MTKGFKDEKDLWKYQKKFLPPTFQRYELMTPAGHPDVKGSYCSVIIYIENKVGDYDNRLLRRAQMESSQIEYLNWLEMCGQPTYVCFGSKMAKRVQWFMLPDLENPIKAPPGWTGPY
jgi:hypothetical protein